MALPSCRHSLAPTTCRGRLAIRNTRTARGHSSSFERRRKAGAESTTARRRGGGLRLRRCVREAARSHVQMVAACRTQSTRGRGKHATTPSQGRPLVQCCVHALMDAISHAQKLDDACDANNATVRRRRHPRCLHIYIQEEPAAWWGRYQFLRARLPLMRSAHHTPNNTRARPASLSFWPWAPFHPATIASSSPLNCGAPSAQQAVTTPLHSRCLNAVTGAGVSCCAA